MLIVILEWSKAILFENISFDLTNLVEPSSFIENKEMMKATEVKIIPMHWNEVQSWNMTLLIFTFICAFTQQIDDRYMARLWTSLQCNEILKILSSCNSVVLSQYRTFSINCILSISFNTVSTSQILVICDLLQMQCC